MKVVRGKNGLKGLSLIEYNQSETILTKMVNHNEENITRPQRTGNKQTCVWGRSQWPSQVFLQFCNYLFNREL